MLRSSSLNEPGVLVEGRIVGWLRHIAAVWTRVVGACVHIESDAMATADSHRSPEGHNNVLVRELPLCG